MTTSLSPRPHHNLHMLGGTPRPVLVVDPGVDAALVSYAGGPGDVAVTYEVPIDELRSGALTHAHRVGLGAAQREVATYRFEDARDGSEQDDTLGADLMPNGGGLWITNIADALATLDTALDILADPYCTGPRYHRERRATESLRAKIAKLVTG